MIGDVLYIGHNSAKKKKKHIKFNLFGFLVVEEEEGVDLLSSSFDVPSRSGHTSNIVRKGEKD